MDMNKFSFFFITSTLSQPTRAPTKTNANFEITCHQNKCPFTKNFGILRLFLMEFHFHPCFENNSSASSTTSGEFNLWEMTVWTIQRRGIETSWTFFNGLKVSFN